MRSQTWPAEAMVVHQSRLLERLFAHARKNVPYYRDLECWQTLDEMPISSLEKLRLVPLLSKELVRSEGGSLYALKDCGPVVKKTTGGTTGPAVRIHKDRSAMGYELAAAWRGYSWAGVKMADRQARFWSMPEHWKGKATAHITDFVCNRTRYTTNGYDERAFRAYEKRFMRDQPSYVYGYTSMLREFADYLASKKFEPKWDLKAVISTAESLTVIDRWRIEKGFGCRVFDEYGCGEIGTIAHECKLGRLHLNSENVIVELIDDSGAIVHEGVGEVVVTDLRNLAMPLVRYRTGDLASVRPEVCECGVALPMLSEVVGRAYDVILAPDGRRFHGSLFGRLFAEFETCSIDIKGWQVIQHQDFSLQLRLIASTEFRLAIEERIARYVREHLGEVVSVRFEYVDSIPREASGKVRKVKSSLGLSEVLDG